MVGGLVRLGWAEGEGSEPVDTNIYTYYFRRTDFFDVT